ncbi:methyltransferase [Ensifer sp. ENS09]|uniref:class I SAM-dependent methyltransferase n=1 Tax=Ensifer sp. ENS09 TaxID=2769263 RepID=UPI001786CCB7|nr:methyltransferase [Ensifer sp. ENS09]MBD9653015.1 methyltransferase [Ensifer sp. ENS09]
MEFEFQSRYDRVEEPGEMQVGMIDVNEKLYSQGELKNLWMPKSKPDDFSYNDGDEIESRILNIVSNAEDTSIFSEELAAGITDWPTLYHFSARRANLIRPIVDYINGNVLEVGAGCGAITRYLAESGKQVLALEGSSRRAQVTAHRCADAENVTVVCDNFDSFVPAQGQLFDTIIIVGVLEYARKFFAATKEQDGCLEFLGKAGRLLAPNGRVILAIENQLGLKYFAGYPEDHVGDTFYGIEDRYHAGDVVTFGRKELQCHLATIGLKCHKWWFPFPDYKLPTTVISEKALEETTGFDAVALCSQSALADPQRPSRTAFSLQRAWGPVCRNGLLPDLANSFLVVASKEELEDTNTLAMHFGTDRRKEFAKSVQFDLVDSGIQVRRKALDEKNFETSYKGITLLLEDETYTRGELWHSLLVDLVSRRGWHTGNLVRWAEIWWAAVNEKAGLLGAETPLKPHSTLPSEMIDAIPRNLIRSRDKFTFVDQEWKPESNIEAGYLLFRGLLDCLLILENCAEPSRDTARTIDHLILDLMYELGFWVSKSEILRYHDLESQFQERAAQGKSGDGVYAFGARLLPITGGFEELVSAATKLQAVRRDNDIVADVLAQKQVELSGMHEQVVHLSEKLGHCQGSYLKVLTELKRVMDLSRELDISSPLYNQIQGVFRMVFAEEWYLSENNDVREAGVDAFWHFLRYGLEEGRQPNPYLK